MIQSEGGYTVISKELPELVTEGDSIDEALENVKDAFVTTLELYEDLGHPLPESIQFSSPAVLPKDISLSLPIVVSKHEGISAPRHISVHRKEVDEAIKEAGGEYRRDNFESHPEQS